MALQDWGFRRNLGRRTRDHPLSDSASLSLIQVHSVISGRRRCVFMSANFQSVA